ncbi:hypothetical protein CB1_007889003 [Camelus ferus]|nr:hypothetical protein CB1_007889003 [Camelus ferus]
MKALPTLSRVLSPPCCGRFSVRDVDGLLGRVFSLGLGDVLDDFAEEEEVHSFGYKRFGRQSGCLVGGGSLQRPDSPAGPALPTPVTGDRLLQHSGPHALHLSGEQSDTCRGGPWNLLMFSSLVDAGSITAPAFLQKSESVGRAEAAREVVSVDWTPALPRSAPTLLLTFTSPLPNPSSKR